MKIVRLDAGGPNAYLNRTMDVLSDILDVLQLRGTLYFRTAFAAPYAVAVPDLGNAARFHLCVQGRCYVVCDAPERTPAELETVLRDADYSGDGVLVYGGEDEGDADTKLVCGHFTFANGADHPLLRALPPYLVVTAELRARAQWLDELMRLITRQMFAGDPGTRASVMRLSEALFIEVIKTCADQDETLATFIEGMSDARIGRALGILHREFDKDWTLERIAREVGMSRSRFADQFQAVIGCAPMGYLSDLRLQKAMNLLAATAEPVQSVAVQVGYQSPAAFTRAFSSRYGRSPREVRRTAH